MNNEYISISELNKYINDMFSEDLFLRHVLIKGEISNFKAHTRGHFYFTLKDETSRINAVMFYGNSKNLNFEPADGIKVLVSGKVNVYEANGNYQIYVDEMLEDGVGNLAIAFEKLKKKLQDEGLFDESHKKKIPKVPKKIGIVTASTGAAVKDILTTIKRRFPICETILFPSLVQGANAAFDIAKKIEIANNYDLDTLIVGRGGGSIEDLWPFNEEIVARAIYNSKIPIISAVGHEIDFTIADFVADLRAPTPTAAAELAVPDIHNIVTYLNNVNNRCNTFIINLINSKESELNKLTSSYILKKPTAMYEIKEQNLDNLIDKLNKEINIIINYYEERLAKSCKNYLLNNPDNLYKYKKQTLDNIISKLEVLNPLNTIKRGYSIVRKDNQVISDINNLKIGDIINIEIKNGKIESSIIKVGE